MKISFENHLFYLTFIYIFAIIKIIGGYMDYIQEIFDFMVKNNLTQKTMAQKLNISENLLNQVLNDKKPLSKKVKRKFELLIQK